MKLINLVLLSVVLCGCVSVEVINEGDDEAGSETVGEDAPEECHSIPLEEGPWFCCCTPPTETSEAFCAMSFFECGDADGVCVFDPEWGYETCQWVS